MDKASSRPVAMVTGAASGIGKGCALAFAQAGFNVLLYHLGEIHAVDVVGTGDDNDIGTLIIEHVQGLINCIGGPEIPVLAATLLSRHWSDVVTEQIRHLPRG